MYEADHFDSSLPLVCGHVARWGFHLVFMKALVSGRMASVPVLVQADLCAPIEGLIVENEEKLSLISMERSDFACTQHDYLNNSCPTFARKLMVALEGVSPKTAAARLAGRPASQTGSQPANQPTSQLASHPVGKKSNFVRPSQNTKSSMF